MDWSKGYSASYYMTIVDPASWRDIKTVDITSGSIVRTTDSLMESADIELTENIGEAWVRVWLDAQQDNGGGRAAVFTGLLQVPAVTNKGNIKTYKAECYSVLKPADDIILQRGWYALKGQNGIEIAARLLSVGPAPVTYEDNAPVLSSNIIAEDGETNLTMARSLIEASGWRIRISGEGEINICPKASEASATFDPLLHDIVEPEITDSRDLYSCPNVFMATSGDLTAIVKDETSDLSISARGREIWKVENSVTLAGESISQYALRRLKEEQAPARTVQYKRRFLPNITPSDSVELYFPGQGIFGRYTVNKQQITLGYAATITETCVEIYDHEAERNTSTFYLIDASDYYFVTSEGDILVGEM